MMERLEGKKVAILTENGFEQSELTSPKEAMEQAGVQVHIVSPQSKEVKAWDAGDWAPFHGWDKRAAAAQSAA